MNSTENLTESRLKKLLRYYPIDGVFSWRIDRSANVYAGGRAGTVESSTGRRIITIDGRKYKAARLACLYMLGSFPIEADHINRIPGDDSWENIRPVTMAQNRMNRSTRSDNGSGFPGVTRVALSGKYRAVIKRKVLGTYDSIHDAIFARYTGELQFGFLEMNKRSPAAEYVHAALKRKTWAED
jgi:hypothetical protein